ncbi:MAG: hypothetical protein ACOYNB_11520 [Aquabacterium sp.]|uniref:hypothetical protein n=1 Tax=Aquabacterium sp. TaxID=1872578 RepID=UPI003BCA6947
MASSTESPFVGIALEVATANLKHPLSIARSRPLLYELKVSDMLEVMQPSQVKKPKRGSSAFETDLCVFEEVAEGVHIPRVVIEFKTGITTHDILTYSAKAERHKRIYPYLRYGMLSSSEKSIPGRAFTHNESLDFFFAVNGLEHEQFESEFLSLLDAEIQASKLLQAISYGKLSTRLFRTEPIAQRA